MPTLIKGGVSYRILLDFLSLKYHCFPTGSTLMNSSNFLQCIFYQKLDLYQWKLFLVICELEYVCLI